MTFADTIQLYAAGSLRSALTAVAKTFEAASGNKVEAKYDPSGLLKNEIVGGAAAHVFASANMEHPQALHDASKSGAVILFARNKLCALVKPGAQAALEKKALQLTGAISSAVPPPGHAVYGWHVAEGRADIFLTYCTNARDAKMQYADQQIVALPDNLSVGADYGLTVMTGASPSASRISSRR